MNGHYVQYELPEGVEVLDVKYRETGYDTSFATSPELFFLNKSIKPMWLLPPLVFLK
jgi:hypothetical protein